MAEVGGEGARFFKAPAPKTDTPKTTPTRTALDRARQAQAATFRSMGGLYEDNAYDKFAKEHGYPSWTAWVNGKVSDKVLAEKKFRKYPKP